MSQYETRSPTRLDTFPAELLLEIFSYLVPRPSTRAPATALGVERHHENKLNLSLRNVKAVCRTFAALAEAPITPHYCDGDMYHVRINAKKMSNWDKIKTVILDDSFYIRRFEEHARRIFARHMNLRKVDRQRQLGLAELWDHDERALIQDELHYGQDSFNLPPDISPLDQEEWRRNFVDQYGCHDAGQTNYERTAILCLTPNVEEILFGSNCAYHYRREGESEDEDWRVLSPIVSAAIGLPFGRVHQFERLRYLSVDAQFMPIGYVVLVMRLPSLRHLVLEWRNWETTGSTEHDVDKVLQEWGCPARSSNVCTIELRNVQLPSPIVGRLLKSCQQLGSFSVDCAMTSTQEQREWYVDVFESLKEHAATLEELVVTSSHTWALRYGAVLDGVKLQQFEKLRKLCIPFRLITGYGSEEPDESKPAFPDMRTLFPRSIKEVELLLHGAVPYEETTEAIASLLRQKTELPCLESVQVTDHILRQRGFIVPGYEYESPIDVQFLSELAARESQIQFGYTVLKYALSDIEEPVRLSNISYDIS